MRYLEQHLIAGERLVLVAGRHGLYVASTLTMGLVFIIVGLSALPFLWWLLLWGMWLVGARFLQQMALEFAITNRRVVIKSGVLGRSLLELVLPQVQAVSVEQGMFGRLFGYGTLVVVGTGGTPQKMRGLSDPESVRAALQNQLESIRTPSPLAATDRS